MRFGFAQLPNYPLGAFNGADPVLDVWQQAAATGRAVNANWWAKYSKLMDSIKYESPGGMGAGTKGQLPAVEGWGVGGAFWTTWASFEKRFEQVKAANRWQYMSDPAWVELGTNYLMMFNQVVRLTREAVAAESAQSQPEDGGYTPGPTAEEKKAAEDRKKAEAAKAKAEKKKAEAERKAREARRAGNEKKVAEYEAEVAKQDKIISDANKGIVASEGLSPMQLVLGAAAAYLLYRAYQSSQEGGYAPPMPMRYAPARRRAYRY